MKITRRQLRQLIEATLSEQNPGSQFAAAKTQGKETSEKEIKAKWGKAIQRTYDWFVGEVFPAIEAGKKFIMSPDKQLAFGFSSTTLAMRPSKRMVVFVIKPKTRIPLPAGKHGGRFMAFQNGVGGFLSGAMDVSIEQVWNQLEATGADPDLDLDVAMESDAGEVLDTDDKKIS